MAGVVNDEMEWIGGTTTVVQVGDMVDRGPDGHGIIDLMIELKEKAKQKGGDVLNVVGNHEIMNLKGDWTFVDSRDLQSFGSRANRAKEFSPSGHYGAYIRSLPLVINIGTILFTHGGLLKQFAVEGIEKINSMGTYGLHNNLDAPILMNDGPVWTREIIFSALKGNCVPLEESLDALSKAEGRPITKMVIGHTAQAGGRMSLLCQNKLAAIDVYSSSFYAGGGWQTFLEISEKDGVFESWRQVGPKKVTQPPESAITALSLPYSNVTHQTTQPIVQTTPMPSILTPTPTISTTAANSNLLVILVVVAIAGAAWWLLVLSPRRRLGLQKKTDSENV
eukprot:TRINITY_DN10684_c0_g2_i1.p1 TRINITY_DN10684_c0_g2~~TRINITY_DN10684_c0_g2_i1.p1  ORF type:complete len:389 (+),score=69.05 TRINITY_DN10684_c0_g2_i1:160-1167(+)